MTSVIPFGGVSILVVINGFWFALKCLDGVEPGIIVPLAIQIKSPVNFVKGQPVAHPVGKLGRIVGTQCVEITDDQIIRRGRPKWIPVGEMLAVNLWNWSRGLTRYVG